MIEKSQQPVLSDIRVKWHVEDGEQIKQTPEQIPSLFNGNRQIVYGFVDYCTRATLYSKLGTHQIEHGVSTSELLFRSGNIIHTLCAKSMVREKDNDDAIYVNLDKIQAQLAKKKFKEQVIKMGIEFNLVTPYTSFIAVEERQENEKIDLAKIKKMNELVQNFEIDVLSYMSWKDQLIISDKDLVDILSTISPSRISDITNLMFFQNRWKMKEFNESIPIEELEKIISDVKLSNEGEKKKFFLYPILFFS